MEEKNPTPSTPFPTNPSPVILTNKPKSKFPHLDKNIIAALAVVLLLLAGVGAGLLLLSQEQDIRSKAATATQGSLNNLSGCSGLEIDPNAKQSCSSFCTNSGCSLPGGLTSGRCEIRRFHSTNKDDSVVNDTQTGFTNSGGGNLGFTQACGAEQIDVGCYTDELNHDGVYNDGFKTVAYAWKRYTESCGGSGPAPTNPPSGGAPPPSGGLPQCGCYGSGECVDKPNNEGPTHPAGECIMDNDKGYCVWDPGRCATGGGGNPPPPPPPGLCDDSCTKDSDCADHGSSGAPLMCNTTIKKCVSKFCPNDTIPGNNCDCRTPVQVCGQPCGNGRVCATGFACRYIVGPICTTSSVSKPTSYCIPNPAPSGYSLPKCVSRDTNNAYIKRNSDGKNIWTKDEVYAEFCQPAATPVSTPVATPTSQSITAQCVAIKIYDSEWNLITADAFSQLQPGEVVRFAAGGSSSGGQFEAARFTINGSVRSEVNAKVTGKDEFYDEYDIPTSTTNFTIKVELRHSSLGWF